MDSAQASGEAVDHDRPPPDTVYDYKPSLMGAPWEFRLWPDRLGWSIGRRSGGIPYRDIQRMRLSFRPATMQSHRFITEIWAPGAPKLTIASTSWRGLMEQTRTDQPYRDFITALHRKIAAAKPDFVFEAGTHPFLYWPGVAIFGAIALSVVALLVRSLQQDFLSATFFLAVIFGFLVWQIGGFFRRNRPRRYRADAIPEEALPKQKR